MILFPIRLTAATARRTAVAPEQPPKPLQPCEVRNLMLKPLFIALLTIREAERFLSLMAIEFAEEYTERLAAACAEVPLKITPPSINNLVAIQKACIAIEEKSVAAQVNEVNKRKRAALEACIDAAIRELKSISVAQADKFCCCGVCANYRYEVASKGHCKWPAYNASQMRPACKRFKRVNEKTEL